MAKYVFYAVKDQFMEPIHTCEAHSKEEAEQLFATIKQLPLDKFKKLYIVDGVQGH